jgi:hypothetical protein
MKHKKAIVPPSNNRTDYLRTYFFLRLLQYKILWLTQMDRISYRSLLEVFSLLPQRHKQTLARASVYKSQKTAAADSCKLHIYNSHTISLSSALANSFMRLVTYNLSHTNI